ncbi:hypothetical protein CFI11_03020 [Thalassococcus sp. S3]|nr:hypothetical protein CFI11_03020 [Thalassococcus sp. S3]
MPQDYDFGFWNAAPSALQVRPYLRENEVLRLSGDATAEKAMMLDTVMLDITGTPVLDLTWRAAIADPETYAAAEIGAHTLTPAPAPQQIGA